MPRADRFLKREMHLLVYINSSRCFDWIVSSYSSFTSYRHNRQNETGNGSGHVIQSKSSNFQFDLQFIVVALMACVAAETLPVAIVSQDMQFNEDGSYKQR